MIFRNAARFISARADSNLQTLQLCQRIPSRAPHKIPENKKKKFQASASTLEESTVFFFGFISDRPQPPDNCRIIW